ncbi:hypothetical protein RhiirA4_474594 [Rhizophagus irregularis]|uniref:F-box domain-containing protein n=1 Tax=Rhizophagus irregularis TaxID=588596 RepID=A0A2I1H8Q6_9GLOM|nr:hypothetical protein RhiirA4_474594 [Rhizophagus irregularis]
MANLLPRESLEQILYHFKSDKKTLVSCVLVNRFWCSTASSILYQRPFKFLNNPSPKLIRTFISCLSQDSKDLLIKSHVNPEIFDLPNSKLNYPSFIRYLDYELIYNSIFELFKEIYEKQQNNNNNKLNNNKFNNNNDNNNNNNYNYNYGIITKRLFTIELFKLIISSTSVIKHLILDIQHIQDVINDGFINFDNDIKSILNTFNSKFCLSQIKKFEYGGIDDLEIMNLLKNYCNQIKSLEFNFYLINSQFGLKKITLRGRYENLGKLFSSVETQIQSLTFLELFECYLNDRIIMEIISKFFNLEILKFIECYNTTYGNKMIPLNFKKLKRFEFKRNNLGNTDPLLSIFKNSTESLKELVLNQNVNRIIDRHSRHRPRVNSMLVKSIGLYCQNLFYLEIFITQNIIIQWYDTLKLLNNLKKLFITIIKDLSNNEEFWINTTINLPPSLSALTILINYDNYNNILCWIMKNCNINLEILQLLGRGLVEPKCIEHIINYYYKFGSLKQLALKEYSYTLKREILLYVKDLFKVSFIGPIGIYEECPKHSSLNIR